MRNKEGLNIMVFLTERCNTLKALQAKLAQQLFDSGPTVAAHPEFIRDTIRLQEQLHRCEFLRDALARALLNGTRLQDTVRATLVHLDARIAQHLATIRAENHSLPANLARESLTVLLAFQQELSTFLDTDTAPCAVVADAADAH